MCYNTSGTNKLHSRNAVPDADLTAFLVKGRKGEKNASDSRKQRYTTEESSCKWFFVLNKAPGPSVVCSVRGHGWWVRHTGGTELPTAVIFCSTWLEMVWENFYLNKMNILPLNRTLGKLRKRFLHFSSVSSNTYHTVNIYVSAM